MTGNNKQTLPQSQQKKKNHNQHKLQEVVNTGKSYLTKVDTGFNTLTLFLRKKNQCQGIDNDHMQSGTVSLLTENKSTRTCVSLLLSSLSLTSLLFLAPVKLKKACCKLPLEVHSGHRMDYC